MNEKEWVVPAPNPDKHVFMKDSEDARHQYNRDCWCKPVLECDPDKPGSDWIWFHPVLN